MHSKIRRTSKWRKWIFNKPIAAFALAGSILFALPSAASAMDYVVKKGDTFWKLSRQYQIPLKSILQANPNVNPRNLQIGQIIRLPLGGYYVVQNDQETFWTIAKKLGIPPERLVKANEHIDPYNIYAGLKLRLPSQNQPTTLAVSNAKKAAAKKPAAAVATAAKTPGPSQVKTVSGEIYTYKKVIHAKATAYSASVSENPWGALDYMGNPLQFGTIAVDPTVIPLNSKVYVTGYIFDGIPKGFVGKATDTGGAVKGNRIDIFIPGSKDYVRKFGIQDVTVYILE